MHGTNWNKKKEGKTQWNTGTDQGETQKEPSGT
jgi:hypothetical protein